LQTASPRRGGRACASRLEEGWEEGKEGDGSSGAAGDDDDEHLLDDDAE